MTILRTLTRRNESRFDDLGSTPLASLNNPANSLYQGIVDFLGGYGGGNANLPSITMRTAPTLSAVFRGVDIIAGTFAHLPLHVFDRDRKTGETSEVWSETERYVWGRPNNEQTRAWFWYTAIAQLLLGGSMYIYRSEILDGFGRREIVTVHPERVRPFRRNGRKLFILDGNEDQPIGQSLADPLGDGMIQVPFVSVDGMVGHGVVASARLTLQLAKAGQEMAASFLTQGSAPGGVLETDADLDEAKADRLVRRWEKYHASYRKANRIAVLDNGAKWRSTTLNAADAQFLESRKFEVTEIARWLGIPPHLLADVQGSTSWGTGLEQQARGFVTWSLLSKIRMVEQAITDEILISRGQKDHYASFNLNALMRADTVARGQAYALGRQWGWYSADDIRRLEDLPPLPDGAGATYLVPLNMQDAAEMLKATEPPTAGIPPAAATG